MKKNTRNTRNARNTYCHFLYPVVFLHLKKLPSELSFRLNCDKKPTKHKKHKKRIPDGFLNVPFFPVDFLFLIPYFQRCRRICFTKTTRWESRHSRPCIRSSGKEKVKNNGYDPSIFNYCTAHSFCFDRA